MNLADTPAGMIARLDDALSRRGQCVKLRTGNTTTGEVSARARVRGYRADELVGIIVHGDSKVVLSPSDLCVFGLPVQGGYVVVDGVPRRIVSVYPIKVSGTLVRVELQVRG